MTARWQPFEVASVALKKKVRYIGYVQRRRPAKVQHFGGLPFASWVQLELEGLKVGGPREFADYEREEAARAHIAYVLRKLAKKDA